MNHALPYREPCGGWGARDNRGGCFQHWRLREAQVPKWENVTRVVNWRCPNEFPGAKGTVPPYERPVGSPYGEGECSGGPPMWGALDWCNTPHTKPPCGYWSRPEFAASCSEGQERVDLNCYKELEGEIANLTRCQKVGFKNVQARKVWHGRFGFKSYDHYGNCGTPATPDDTKYLTIARSATIAIVPESPDGGETPAGQGTHSCTVSWSNTVDSDSGVVTPNSCSIPDPVSYSGCNDGVSQTQINDAIGLANVNGCGENILWPEDEGGYSGTSALGLMGQIVNGTDSEIPGVELKGVVDSYEFTNTHIHVSVHKLMLDAECGWHKYTLTVEATLSDPYTATEVKEEAEALLALWDLTDDAVYPWRRDRFTTVAPLVTYDEVPQAVSPDGVATNFGAAAYVDNRLRIHKGSSDASGPPCPYA